MLAPARAASGKARPTVEGTPRLDVFRLYRAGGLTHGAETIVQWPSSTVHIRADHSRLLVSIAGGAETVVQFSFQARRDGDRPYFLCAACDRQAYRLYGDRLQCRRCSGLVYSVRHERRWCPALQRVYNLRAKLGAELVPFGSLPPREWRGRAGPRHDRLVAQIRAAEAEVLSRSGRPRRPLPRYIGARDEETKAG
jgi:hypothetical protein